MSKRNRTSTSKIIKKRVAEGRGQGRGKEYEPWLFIQDVPSQGLATRIEGWKTGRIHHFLSKLELRYFFILEWPQIVTDIREQYPLDRDETIAIAKNLGIRHPTDPKTKEPVVLTTDFLITLRKSIGLEEQARTIKYTKDLASIRVMEKFEIERIYWTLRGIDWGIVTERDIDPIVAANVEWVHPYRNLSNLGSITNSIVHQVESILTHHVAQEKAPLSELTGACDDELGLETGTSLSIVRHLIATRVWEVNMNINLQPKKKLILIAQPSAFKIVASEI